MNSSNESGEGATGNTDGPAKKPRKVKEFERLYFSYPWQCHHYGDYSELHVYVEKSAAWENLVTIRSSGGLSAEDLAKFICHLVNEHETNRSFLLKAMQALEASLDDNRLSFSSEQGVERAMEAIKKAI